MTFEESKEILLQVILEVQAGSGRSIPDFIHGGLCPIGDFEGFDSLNGVEVSSLLSSYLDHTIPNNIMLPTHPWIQLTIDEIAGRLYQIMEA